MTRRAKQGYLVMFTPPCRSCASLRSRHSHVLVQHGRNEFRCATGLMQNEATVYRARIADAGTMKRGIQRREFAQLGVLVSEASVVSSAKV
jgi:hypothetical protein